MSVTLNLSDICGLSKSFVKPNVDSVQSSSIKMAHIHVEYPVCSECHMVYSCANVFSNDTSN